MLALDIFLVFLTGSFLYDNIEADEFRCLCIPIAFVSRFNADSDSSAEAEGDL